MSRLATTFMAVGSNRIEHSFYCDKCANAYKRIINQSRLLVVTYPCPDIDGLGVCYRRQRVVNGGRLRGHSEKGCHAKRDSGGDGIRVQPEADPRHDHEHAAGNVDGEEIVRKLALECQVDGEAAVLAWK